jgi:hypothetical protein
MDVQRRRLKKYPMPPIMMDNSGLPRDEIECREFLNEGEKDTPVLFWFRGLRDVAAKGCVQVAGMIAAPKSDGPVGGVGSDEGRRP